METNVLIALKNLFLNAENIVNVQASALNSANATGEPFEYFIKDIFCGSILISGKEKKEEAYRKFFSWLGGAKNPPDFIIKSGDSFEVKKREGSGGTIQLNSSYPKDVLHSSSPLISAACRNCEDEPWKTKDMFYIVGSLIGSAIASIWIVDGKCYAANEDVYLRIRNAISEGITSLPDIDFGDTNELGRVNEVDPLKITNLRIRGMWTIKHPSEIFTYLTIPSQDKAFTVNALMLSEKFESFPKTDRNELVKLKPNGFHIEDVKVKAPSNPAKMLAAKLINFAK